MNVPGVRVVPITAPELTIDVLSSEPETASAEVEAEWNRRRAANPRLFDGPVLSVVNIDGEQGIVRCTIDSYKRLVVQPTIETGVRQLSVTGVLTGIDEHGSRRVLLGRRSHKTRMYGGMWQNCPAGGIDPKPGVSRMTHRDIADELRREVMEEAGLAEAAVGRPVAVIFDERARSHDIIVPVDVGEIGKTVKGWEYDELRWVHTADVIAFDYSESESFMAITRAVFRVMGWA